MPVSDAIPDGLEVRAYEERDFAAMQALFESIFNDTMSAAFHAWKYQPGKSGAVVVYKDQELVGHYGGIGTDIYMQGQPAKAIQIVDVMIKPSARIAVRTHSPFFLAGARFLEQFIGYQQPYLLGYGFPSDRHLRLAQRLGLYAPVGSMLQLQWPAGKAGQGMGLLHRVSQVTADNFPQFHPVLDQLWQRMLAGFNQQYLVKKDGAFVDWRYLSNPCRQYRVLLVQHRLTNTPVGLIVLKELPDHLLLMDLIAMPRDFSRLVALASNETASHPGKVLRTWCPESWLQLFPLAHAQQMRLNISTPANIWTPGPAPETIQGRWWLMPGDTDFL